MTRLKNCFQWMEKEGFDALWLEDPTDLFYLTGLSFSAGRLVLENGDATLLVDGRYYEMAKQKAAHFQVVLYEKEGSFHPFKRAKKVAFDSAMLSFDRYQVLKRAFREQEWVPNSCPLKGIRVCKEEQELIALKKAAQLTWQGYQHVLTLLKVGVSETELAWQFERFCRENGASSLAFEPIIAFGENSAYPHYRPQKGCKLKEGEIVLIDVGAVVDRYCGDMTRTAFFGKPNEKLLHLEKLVRKAHDLAFQAARPGVKVGELDQIVHSFFAKEGVESLFPHSLGHGIGLEVHEYPRLRFDGVDKEITLTPGMVFTIEPGLYMPGVGGIRYENTVAVTEDGVENFYAPI